MCMTIVYKPAVCVTAHACCVQYLGDLPHAEEAEHVIDTVGMEILLHVLEAPLPPRAAIPARFEHTSLTSLQIKKSFSGAD